MAGNSMCRWNISRHVLGAPNRDQRPLASPHLTHHRPICSASHKSTHTTLSAFTFQSYLTQLEREPSIHHQSSMSGHIEAHTEESDENTAVNL